jgi:hypothetical protein
MRLENKILAAMHHRLFVLNARGKFDEIKVSMDVRSLLATEIQWKSFTAHACMNY